ncbi:MAG: preprotein translocase subunit SecE [Coriobacteriia bacterium]|nr:preprotein translocase subunit SecE [Coriobacteriia bacterium]
MAQSKKGAEKPGVFKRIGKYFKDVRIELRRVVWPDRQEVLNSSMVVVATLIFFVFFTLIIDNISSYVFIDVLAGIGR